MADVVSANDSLATNQTSVTPTAIPAIPNVDLSTTASESPRVLARQIPPTAFRDSTPPPPTSFTIVATGLVNLPAGSGGGQVAQMNIPHGLSFAPIPFAYETGATETLYNPFPVSVDITNGVLSFSIEATTIEVIINWSTDTFTSTYVRYYLLQPPANLAVITNQPRVEFF